jgi:integrase
MLEDPSHGSWYYWIKVTAEDGARVRVRRGGFEDESAAVAARDAAIAEPSPWVLALAWTVEKWLTMWLAGVELRPATVEGYESVVRHHLIPVLGSRRVSELEVRDVRQAMDAIARRPKRDGTLLANSTQAGILAVLRSAFGAARRHGYIRFNPAFGVRKPRPTRPYAVVWTPERIAMWRETGWRPKVAVWDPDTLAGFFAKIADEPLMPLYRLIATTGPRRGEASALQADDFDFVDRSVAVTKQMHVAGRGKQPWLGPPKSAAGTRVSPLDEITNRLLAETWRRVVADPRREIRNPRGCLFLQPDGRPVSPDYLTRHFARLVKQHAMPPIRLHDMRHEAASMLGAAGVEPHVIQDILGHSSAVTTVDTYWQVFRELATDAVNRSADLLRTHSARRRHLGAATLA